MQVHYNSTPKEHSMDLRLLRLIQAYPQLILSIAVVLLFFFLFHHLLHQSPLPINWPILGMLPPIAYAFNHLHDTITDILSYTNQTFLFKGPYLFGNNILITCDPSNVHHILTLNHINFPKGEDFAEIFDVLGDGIFCADGESWLIQRRMAKDLMVKKEYRSFVLRTTREIAERRLVPLLDRWATVDEAVDLENVFKRMTFDVTCVSSFGIDLRALSVDFPTVPFAEAIDDAWQATAFRHMVPKSIWKLLRTLRVGEERKLSKAKKVIDNFIMQQISRKRDELSERSPSSSTEFDLLTSYMCQSKDFDNKFLRDTALGLMIAGKDAFGITLTWLFFLLSKHPQVEERILQELKTKKFKTSDEEDINSIVYLHAVVCEVMRLYPPIPIEHKGVLNTEELPSGHQVEPRMTILISLYAMGRMEEIWGKDCLEFKPERWISENGKLRHVPAYKFLVFNAGPRSCIGKEIGLTQLKMVAAEMIWNFTVEVIKEKDVVVENSVFLGTKNGMHVRVRKRDQC